tara:strand:- start:224 stop:424 length:201 start_codon:yes stop_codon:yes gene_type:complete
MSTADDTFDIDEDLAEEEAVDCAKFILGVPDIIHIGLCEQRNGEVMDILVSALISANRIESITLYR